MIKATDKQRERFQKALRKYKPVIKRAIEADINESDTVTIIVDILADMFGYDKFADITSEFAIKKRFCDLAIVSKGEIKLLIEVKAIGITLNREHLSQAVHYATDSGVEWVMLTNGQSWQLYHLTFGKPVDYSLVYSFSFTDLSIKQDSDLEYLTLLSRESLFKTSTNLNDFYNQKKLLDRMVIGQIVQSEPVVKAIKSVMKKMAKETKVTDEEIMYILANGVIRRDIIDDDKANSVKNRIKKAIK